MAGIFILLLCLLFLAGSGSFGSLLGRFLFCGVVRGDCELRKLNTGTATAISLVFLSAVLTGLSWYDDIAKIAGAGTIVPITGFANAVVSPAIEFKAEGFVTGMAAKMFTIAGPVIVYGTTASVVYGIIYWLCTR